MSTSTPQTLRAATTGRNSPSHEFGRRALGPATALLSGLGILIGLGSLRYVFLGDAAVPPELVAHVQERPLSFYLHIAGSTLALIIAPFQFLGALRTRNPALHRTFGVLYVMGCALGGLSGVYIGVNSPNGPVAALGFSALGMVWLTTTTLGVFHLFRGAIPRHRRWMVRSFSLTLAAVTLRLYMPIFTLGGVDTVAMYGVLAWICWLPNLAVAEWLLRAPRPIPEVGGRGTL